MRVKNIFSSRKTKKKKTPQQPTSSVNEVGETAGNNADELIIPTDSGYGTTSGKAVEREAEIGPRRNIDDLYEGAKPRTSSTSSSNSIKPRSRRPWSFIEQVRRQDSRESAYSTGSSARTSQVAEDLLESLPPPQYDAAVSVSWSNSGTRTLPRSLTPEEVRKAAKTGTQRHDNSAKRRTMDFRFFSFFKRSSSGDSDSTVSSASGLTSSGRSSFRSKSKGKKKGSSKKKRDAEESTTMGSCGGRPDLTRLRSFSDGGETSPTITFDEDLLQIPPPGLYDSDPKLTRLDEYREPTPRKVAGNRVPVNGEPAAFYFVDDDDAQDSNAESSPTGTVTGEKANTRKYLRRSDPTANSTLRCQKSDGDACGVDLARSASDSADSSRRSSLLCEPRDSSLPEDSVATFDSSACFAARARMLHSGGSVPQIPHAVHNQKVFRSSSNDIPKLHSALSAQTRYSQSVSNLAIGHSSTLLSVPRSSPDVNRPRLSRKMPQPSPHQQKQEQRGGARLLTGASSSDFVPPPSPVLRAIGFPGVVLRREKGKPSSKPRPNSAYADQRTQQVLSLNVEDLPTYSQMRFDMAKVTAYPSQEDILAVRESGAKRSSGGVQFASTASGRARRRGTTLSNYGQRVSAGFSTAASVEDLAGSLSSSNYGSKQSLSDLARRMDDDEVLNALLAKSHTLTHTSSGSLRIQEPSSKRAKGIRKSVVSLANLISPGKPHQKGKLQRSSSFKESGSSAPASNNAAATYSFKPYRPPSNTPHRGKNNRRSKLWCETFDHTGLNEAEIKWQEAIFELYQGERDLVQDLTMAKQTYRDSMVTLKMLSDDEVALIFGKLDCLLPLHEELLGKLERARGEDGRTLAIGYIGVEWFPQISTAYRAYCANQSDAKYALDAAVERDARVRDFLQRCLESPFSRKLDLWSYLDLPRTRLVKYPLLLQNVLKRTPPRLQEERESLSKVLEIVGEIIERVDETTGEQQCRYIRSKLEYLDDKQKSSFVDSSRLMLCSGQLKNNRGTKMHVFLFEEALVLTRQTTRGNNLSYQVYRPPLPLRSLVVDTNEGEKLSGSFRGGILSSEKVKHSFRVRSEELNVAYTLQASEEHDRKQWINAIQDALAKHKAKHPDAAALAPHPPVSRRRATYDPASRRARERAVLRSPSEKSNDSAANSSDKSSALDESQDDASTASEELGPWRRTRSQTVNPSLLASKSSSSVSRNSSGSSTKSDRSGEGGGRRDADVKRLKERLRTLESEKSRGDGFGGKKSLISRHFSLGKADKAHRSAPVTKRDLDEKTRNKCQRSRSLTSSPQIAKPVAAPPSGSKRLSHGKLATLQVANLGCPNAAKPPIGRAASPLFLRRVPSLRAGGGGELHAAQSTPDLTVLGTRGASLCGARRSLAKGAALLAAQNCSNSVGNLREGLAANAGSTSDLGGVVDERLTEEALTLRRVRSNAIASSEVRAEYDATFPDSDKTAVGESVDATEDAPMEIAVVEEAPSPRDGVTDVNPCVDVIVESADDVVAEFSVSEAIQSDGTEERSGGTDLMGFGNGEIEEGSNNPRERGTAIEHLKVAEEISLDAAKVEEERLEIAEEGSLETAKEEEQLEVAEEGSLETAKEEEHLEVVEEGSLEMAKEEEHFVVVEESAAETSKEEEHLEVVEEGCLESVKEEESAADLPVEEVVRMEIDDENTLLSVSSENPTPAFKDAMDVGNAASENGDENERSEEFCGGVLDEVDDAYVISSPNADSDAQKCPDSDAQKCPDSDVQKCPDSDAQTCPDSGKEAKPLCCRDDVKDENSNNGQLNLQASA